MDKKQQIIESYNKSAKALATRFNDIGARVDDIKRGFSYINKKNPKVLEIGCSNGREAKEIVKHTSNYLGIDISEKLIEIARKENPDGKFEVADIENYIFPKGIDIIFAFASLLHSDENKIKKILDLAGEALNKEGIFYLSLKYGDYQELTKEDEFGTRTYYFYTPELIKELVSDKYKSIYEDVQDFKGQKWFTIVLRK